MKLHYLPGTCSFVVHYALEEIGLPYEAIEVPRDQLRSPEFLQFSPMGTVPVFQDGAFLLSQTVAILNYLYMKYPSQSIFGIGDIQEKATVSQWLTFFNTDIHKTFRSIFHPNYCVDTDEGKKDLQNHERNNVVRLLNIPNKQLQKGDTLMGNYWTVADVYLYIFVRWCKRLDLDISKYGALLASMSKLEQTPTVVKLLQREKLDPIF